MPRFDPNEYEDVAARIKRFKADHPTSRIITQSLSDANARDWVVIRAEVFLSDADRFPAASGIAQEQPGQGANLTSWWENAETSAVGRALANCGYSGDKRASREEMAKANRPIGQGASVAVDTVRQGRFSDNAPPRQHYRPEARPVATGFSDSDDPFKGS